jgi:hypothetical protein
MLLLMMMMVGRRYVILRETNDMTSTDTFLSVVNATASDHELSGRCKLQSGTRSPL